MPGRSQRTTLARAVGSAAVALATATLAMATTAAALRAQDPAADEQRSGAPTAAVRAAAARIEHLPYWGRAAAALVAPVDAEVRAAAAAGPSARSGAPVVPVGDGRGGGAGRQAIAAAVRAAGMAPGARLSFGQSAMAFAAGQRIAAAEQTLGAWGLPARDLAAAAAFAFVTDWKLATGRSLGDASAGPVARALTRRLAAAAPDAVGALDAPGRAAAYDALLGHAAALTELARGADAPLAAGVRQAAAASFLRQFGVMPSAVRLDAAVGAAAVADAAGADARGAEARGVEARGVETAPVGAPATAPGRMSGAASRAVASGARDAAVGADGDVPARLPDRGRGTGDGDAAAATGVAGIWRADWIENEYQAMVGLALVAHNVTLVLTPDGYFINGIPHGHGLDGTAARDLMAAAPDRAGRYQVQGRTLVLTYASGRRTTATVTSEGSGAGRVALVLDRRTLARKLTVPDGTHLDGVYVQERITQVSGMNAPGGATTVTGASDVRFSPDGRFEAGSSTSFTSPSASRIGGRRRQAGRYTIQGGALTLEFDDGGRSVRSIWQENRGGPIWLDDEMWTPRR